MKTFVLRMVRLGLVLQVALGCWLSAQTRSPWRAASAAELAAALPGRAQVGNERIETELRTATGIIDTHGQVVAAVVLITAGYAADGKYSHYLLVQQPIVLAEQPLPAGSYVVGWSHGDEGLTVHIFDARSGAEKRTLLAKPIPASHRVESFHIWPPAERGAGPERAGQERANQDRPGQERSIIQIGRYMLPYSLVAP